MLAVEVDLIEGMLLTKSGEFERADQRLSAALTKALEHQLERLAIELLPRLIYTVGVDRAELSSGLRLGGVAQGLVERPTVSTRDRASAYIAIGQVHYQRGESLDAQRWLERAIALLEPSEGRGPLLLAEALDSMGVLLKQRHYYAEALEQYERALDIRAHWYGDQHPEFAHQLINLGLVLDEQRHHEKAQRQYRRALDILAPTPSHEFRAHARFALGYSLIKVREYESAVEQYETNLDEWKRLYGVEHLRVGRTHLNLGTALLGLGRTTDAIAQFERALAVAAANERTHSTEQLAEQARTFIERARARARQ